jgi:hypothetical protein
MARDVQVNATLWALILGSIMFLAVFVLFIGLIPSECTILGGAKGLPDYNIGSASISGTSITMWNNSNNMNMTVNSDFIFHRQYIKLSGIELEFTMGNYVGMKLQKGESIYHFLQIRHITGRLPSWLGSLIYSANDLVDKSGNVYITKSILATHFDNSTGVARIVMHNDVITLDLTLKSLNSTNILNGWDNDGTIIFIGINFSIDWSKMGTNIWMLIGQILTFSTIQTGFVPLDLVLNTMVSLPIYLSGGYILYRLITGLIPTLSGGGGQ